MRTPFVVAALAVSGCAGQLQTTKLDPDSTYLDPQAQSVSGVIYYAPKFVTISHVYTELVDKSGNFIGSAPHACTPVVQREERQIIPDLSKPYLLGQTRGFLHSNKLTVTLSNGMLASVNSESQSTVPELITAAAAVATAAAGFRTADGPSALADTTGSRLACNASPRIQL